MDQFFGAKEESALQTDEIAKCLQALYAGNDVYSTFMGELAVTHQADEKKINKERQIRANL